MKQWSSISSALEWKNTFKIYVCVFLLAIVLATKKEWIVSKDGFNFIYSSNI